MRTYLALLVAVALILSATVVEAKKKNKGSKEKDVLDCMLACDKDVSFVCANGKTYTNKCICKCVTNKGRKCVSGSCASEDEMSALHDMFKLRLEDAKRKAMDRADDHAQQLKDDMEKENEKLNGMMTKEIDALRKKALADKKAAEKEAKRLARKLDEKKDDLKEAKKALRKHERNKDAKKLRKDQRKEQKKEMRQENKQQKKEAREAKREAEKKAHKKAINKLNKKLKKVEKNLKKQKKNVKKQKKNVKKQKKNANKQKKNVKKQKKNVKKHKKNSRKFKKRYNKHMRKHHPRNDDDGSGISGSGSGSGDDDYYGSGGSSGDWSDDDDDSVIVDDDDEYSGSYSGSGSGDYDGSGSGSGGDYYDGSDNDKDEFDDMTSTTSTTFVDATSTTSTTDAGEVIGTSTTPTTDVPVGTSSTTTSASSSDDTSTATSTTTSTFVSTSSSEVEDEGDDESTVDDSEDSEDDEDYNLSVNNVILDVNAGKLDVFVTEPVSSPHWDRVVLFSNDVNFNMRLGASQRNRRDADETSSQQTYTFEKDELNSLKLSNPSNLFFAVDEGFASINGFAVEPVNMDEAKSVTLLKDTEGPTLTNFVYSPTFNTLRFFFDEPVSELTTRGFAIQAVGQNPEVAHRLTNGDIVFIDDSKMEVLVTLTDMDIKIIKTFIDDKVFASVRPVAAKDMAGNQATKIGTNKAIEGFVESPLIISDNNAQERDVSSSVGSSVPIAMGIVAGLICLVLLVAFIVLRRRKTETKMAAKMAAVNAMEWDDNSISMSASPMITNQDEALQWDDSDMSDSLNKEAAQPELLPAEEKWDARSYLSQRDAVTENADSGSIYSLDNSDSGSIYDIISLQESELEFDDEFSPSDFNSDGAPLF